MAKKPKALLEPTLIRLKVSEVLPWSENPRQHNEEQLRLLGKSISHYGLVALPIVQAGTRRLIAGHGRIQALMAAGHGEREIPVLEVAMTDEDALAYTITDNRLTDLSEWKLPELKSALAELDNGAFDIEWTGFDDEALKKLFPEDEGPPEFDDGEKKERVPDGSILPGDLILLGDHLGLTLDETSTPEDLNQAVFFRDQWEEDTGRRAKVLRHGKEVKR